ncbi:MAG TPA: hypothetical protein PK760_05990, partial [Flavobacteriales bacterium]|nr:hypothetical protein [Flavobacteriales bacterium]
WDGYYYLVPNLPDGQPFSIDYWDANGCHGFFDGTIGYPVDWPLVSVLTVEPSCEDVANGSVTFTTSGEGHGLDVMYQVLDDQSVPVGFPPITTGSPGTYTIGNIPPGTFTLAVRTMNTPSVFQLAYCYAPTQIQITVPNAGPGCGMVSGQAFIDLDTDCILDAVEPHLSNTIIEIQPGPYYAGSSYGSYSATLPWGTYTITSTSPNATLSCPSTFTIDGANTYVQLNLGHTSTTPMDVSIAASSGPARPGFPLNQSLYVANNSAQSTGNVTVTMQFDPTLSFTSANPTPSNVAGNTITWVRPPQPAFEGGLIQVQFQVPPDIGLLGTQLVHTATATPQLTDAFPLNNTITIYRTITGSVDPNEKLARTSTGASDALYFINEDEWIDYTINFQNTGTDTAFTVVVTDTLPATLDPSTLRVDASSHPFEWSLSGRTLRVIFTDILLPDSNVNEPASHGFVALRIAPMQPLFAGTVLENVANIFFDFNPPVITEPSVLTAEFSTAVSGGDRKLNEAWTAYPNPVSDRLLLRSSKSDARITAWIILQADGRAVRSSSTPFPTGGLVITDLAEGAYILQAVSPSGPISIPFIRTH